MKTEIQVRKGKQIIFWANCPMDKGQGQVIGAFQQILLVDRVGVRQAPTLAWPPI